MSIKLLMRMLVDYLIFMNKYYLDGVLVVEGKSDVSYLSSFIKTHYFITNGCDISDEKIEFLSRVSERRKVIVMSDNDKAGEDIANKIKNKISKAFVIKSAKIPRKSYKKCGVAETEYEAIIDALKDHLTEYKKELDVKPLYELNSIISLSENPEIMKNRIINDYRLIYGTTKFLENQLQMLGVKPSEISEKYGNK